MNDYSTYAHNEKKELVHVDSVQKGLLCNCTCPHCNKPLIAKNRGKIRTHHFAHLHGFTCESAYETTLHLLAKEVLTEEKKLMFPITENENFPSGQISFIDVEQEKNLDVFNIRPDAIGTMPNGETVLIEFYVSHKVSGKKRDVILQNNLKCIEIDLNYVEMDKSAIRKYLLTEYRYRSWIKEYDKRLEGNGYGSYYTRNPLHKKTIDLLKEKFENETIKIIVSDWQTGRKTHDLKTCGYDVCEVSSSSFRGIKPDLLLYRSEKEDKGFIAICLRGRRRSSDFTPPTNLRIIDIIIRENNDYIRFNVQDAISYYDTNVVFYGFKFPESPKIEEHRYNSYSNYGLQEITSDYPSLWDNFFYDEEIINDTRIGLKAPF